MVLARTIQLSVAEMNLSTEGKFTIRTYSCYETPRHGNIAESYEELESQLGSPSPVPTYPIESALFFSLLLQMFFVNNIQATAWSTDNSGAKMETKQTRALAFNPLVL